MDNLYRIIKWDRTGTGFLYWDHTRWSYRGQTWKTQSGALKALLKLQNATGPTFAHGEKRELWRLELVQGDHARLPGSLVRYYQKKIEDENTQIRIANLEQNVRSLSVGLDDLEDAIQRLLF